MEVNDGGNDRLYRIGVALLAAITIALLMTFLSVWFWPAPAPGLTLHFIVATGPDGQTIEISVDQIVSLRERRPTEEHLHEEVRCQVNTADGKFTGVRETCKVIEERMDELYKRRREEQGDQ